MSEHNGQSQLSSEVFYILLGVSIMLSGIWGFRHYLLPTNQRLTSEDNSDSLNQQEFNELTRLCSEQEAEQLEDSFTIRNALTLCNQEMAAFNRQIAPYTTAFFDKTTTHVAVSSADVHKKHQRIEKLNQLIELMNTYPAFPEDVSLANLQTYHQDSFTHHQHVIDIVQTYLPDTYDILTAAKNKYSACLHNENFKQIY